MAPRGASIQRIYLLFYQIPPKFNYHEKFGKNVIKQFYLHSTHSITSWWGLLRMPYL